MQHWRRQHDQGHWTGGAKPPMPQVESFFGHCIEEANKTLHVDCFLGGYHIGGVNVANATGNLHHCLCCFCGVVLVLVVVVAITNLVLLLLPLLHCFCYCCNCCCTIYPKPNAAVLVIVVLKLSSYICVGWCFCLLLILCYWWCYCHHYYCDKIWTQWLGQTFASIHMCTDF